MTQDKIKKSDPAVALTIFQGAVENLEAAGVDLQIGHNPAGDALIVFGPGVHLCRTCGKFSAGAGCQYTKCQHGSDLAAVDAGSGARTESP